MATSRRARSFSTVGSVSIESSSVGPPFRGYWDVSQVEIGPPGASVSVVFPAILLPPASAVVLRPAHVLVYARRARCRPLERRSIEAVLQDRLHVPVRPCVPRDGAGARGLEPLAPVATLEPQDAETRPVALL